MKYFEAPVFDLSRMCDLSCDRVNVKVLYIYIVFIITITFIKITNLSNFYIFIFYFLTLTKKRYTNYATRVCLMVKIKVKIILVDLSIRDSIIID